MTVYEYRPHNLGITPTPAPGLPANLGSPAPVVGGDTALDTSDGYTSWVKVTSQGIGLNTVEFRGLAFTFEPVAAAAPTANVKRIWWEIDHQRDAKVEQPGVAANQVIMWGYFGFGYMQVLAKSGFDAHSFGDPESEDLFPSFLVYAETLIGGTFIVGAGAARQLGELVEVDVTRITMFVEAGETYLRNHARTDGLGGNAPRNHQVTSQQRSLRNKGYR